MTNETLHQKTVDCVAKYKRAEGELISLLQEVEIRRAYFDHGLTSLFRYCTELLKLTEAESYRFVQLARKAIQIPELKKAIESEEVSVSKASRIVPLLTPENATNWIEKARNMTYRELDREIAKENPRPPIQEKVRPLSEENSELRVNMNRETESLLRKAQDLLSKKQRRSVTMSEVVATLLEDFVQRNDPSEKAKRGRKPAARQVSQIPDSPARVRVPIAAHIKHQVHLRDRGQCTFRNKNSVRCGETRFTEIHHVKEIRKGGVNSVENLQTLCSAHHRWLHKHHNARYGDAA